MNSSIITHVFNIPPATDVEALMSFIGRLLIAHQVPSEIPETSMKDVDHPIEESKQILTDEVFRLNELIRTLRFQYKSVEVTDARLAGLTVVITFSCSGDLSNEFISIS